MATLKDVARLACVDVSTVSRALNNTSYVHPDTKARIYAAAKELGYHPNVLAQALRQGEAVSEQDGKEGGGQADGREEAFLAA